MQLLLSLCLTWALLPTAELLRCHECANEGCANITSTECPATSPICRTITSLTTSGSNLILTVNKNCSTLLNCITPLTIETEWSVNRGFSRSSHTQICCATDNCNFQTLAVPNILTNGKVCPSCASSADSMAGTCNSTLSCMGAEDSCFNGTSTSNSSQVIERGCLSRNLCTNVLIRQALFGANSQVVCRAPWSVRLSAVLLTFALTACKVLV
ncbi:uncharacterized protein [Thunnus thynnus]|uniref:uncharacterized protein n=1 Tax=Thunnus thynnus TaxID=8237 RepID=UPI0035287E4F